MTRPTSAALPALALAGSLLLAACGGGESVETAAGTSSQHGAGHGGSSAAPAQGNDSDVAFLAGMTPHHAQAVEMSEIVLAADPPADVAALAERIQQAQAPEIEQMEAMLADLGQANSGGGHGAGHGGGGGEGGHGAGHAGMLSDADLAELEAATGTQAARLYLEGMIAHHAGAIEASDAQIAGGQYAPAVELARRIKQQQSAEITEMRAVLGAL